MKLSASQIVDRVLEGESLSSLLAQPEDTMVGKRLVGVQCPNCSSADTLIVQRVLESDPAGFYNIVAGCSQCNEVNEFEIVVKEGTELKCTADQLIYEGMLFSNIPAPLLEGGLMNGNYLLFNRGTQAWMVKDGDSYTITFGEQPEDGIKLNPAVTFKVISFRNQKARLMNMTNDKANRLAAGTVFYCDKAELQQHAKFAKPRSNPSMDGKFKF